MFMVKLIIIVIVIKIELKIIKFLLNLINWDMSLFNFGLLNEFILLESLINGFRCLYFFE